MPTSVYSYNMSRNSDNTRIYRVKTRGSALSTQLKGRDYKGKRNVTSFVSDDTELQLQHGESVIHPQILKQARRSGQLNLSNRGMVEVPNIVWNINKITPEEGQQLSLVMDETDGQRWWDQVVLNKLILASNKLSTISSEISNLVDLTVLDVHDNQLTSLPDTLGDLLALTKLSLGHNHLQTLPKNIFYLKELHSLFLQYNQIEVLEEDIGQLTLLEHLDLSYNRLRSIPYTLGYLTHLWKLNLSNNKLKFLPPEVGNMCALRCLDITHNALTKLPDEIGSLSKLEQLFVRHNQLVCLPFLKSCTSLKELQAGNNRITEVPQELLETIKSVKILDLRDNKISTLPEEITILQELERLDLSNNSLSSGKVLNNIPEELVKKAAEEEVTSINLSKNALTDISPCLDILASKVSELNLAFNKFSSLPQLVGNFSKLLYLDLRNNQLGDLPLELSKLSTLRELYLCNNRFEKIPTVVFTFDKLEILFASDNRITSINVLGLTKLPILTVLDLRNNNITNVPPELGNLRQLRSLVLEGNPFRNPRPAILAKGTPALLNYLRDRIPC
ncbi:leucine-rich repeat-containing protein 40-like isoform X2 [Limulus polyphemus]|uniref:Leucine-rich repeat-containing protein 40-like isoform X2 n=1 Tax=Limulus polyphemus TaxID=6850 RepID=A0ABM1T611_LIMPO|nr:leucine-rich repeat-containing protein 40-like isoform X2 [Limulus polyphemus]